MFARMSWVRVPFAVSLLAVTLAAPVVRAQDADADGVPDLADAVPCDAAASAVTYIPAEGASSMMAWEDLWPSAGDLDFNDLVFSVQWALRSSAGKVTSARLTLGVLAVGSDYHNGFGLHLPVPKDQVQEVLLSVDGQPATALTPAPDGELTVVLFDDARTLFGGQEGPINSLGAPLAAPQVVVEVSFATPVTLSAAEAPYDLFLFRSNDPTHQVHPPAYAGTLAMDAALFGTADDGSGGGRNFVDTRGLPFVLTFPQVVPYPAELTSIEQLYPDIVGFAASGGATNADFYLTHVQPAAAYATPASSPAVTAADLSCLIGASPRGAGTSCQTLKDALGTNAADGLYWIDPDGPGYGRDAFEVYCDMHRHGGGWEILHFDDYLHARQPRGTPGPNPGWSVDYTSAASGLAQASIDAFFIDVEGGPSRVFDGLKRFGTAQAPTVADLFSGTHPNTWSCNSDSPSASACHFTTADGRHWGVWEYTRSCCIGSDTGGFWYYSQSAAGTENYGMCGLGYPNGAGYAGTTSGCSGAGYYTPVAPAGSAIFTLAVKLHVPLTAEGATCRTILAAGKSRGDGLYVIDPDGPYGAEPMQAWCDMSTDGGGWIVVHDDDYAHARVPRGTPSAGTGWSVDYLSAQSSLSRLQIEDFAFEVPGAWAQTFRGVRGFGGARPLTPVDLFNGTHPNTWTCNSDSPGAGCAFTTQDGRTWGLWESTSACCIGSGTGGFWFYSRAAAGTENYGMCGAGFPNGAAYSGSASGCSGAGYYTPVSPAGSRRFVLKLREPAQPAALNTPSAARSSCRAILDAGASVGSGIYWIHGPGLDPIRAYCDMVTDGGGWTTFFAGVNGSLNVFDHFDAAVFKGRCMDAGTRCLRRLPAGLSTADTELLFVHGAAAVKVPASAPLLGYFTLGTQAGWVTATGQEVTPGAVRAGINSVWTGQGSNLGFIGAINQSPGWVFLSQYDFNATWDSGNKLADVSTPVKLMYREGGAPALPVLNSLASARASCLAIRDLGEAQGSGLYWVDPDGGAPYVAYCDMVSAGGGWTAFVVGHNGSAHVARHLDAAYYALTCPDPGRTCVRRLPASVPATAHLAVAIGPNVVAAPFEAGVYAWARQGTQAAWRSMTFSTVAGTPGVVPNTFWTGQGSNTAWIAARNQTSNGSVFAAQYDFNTGWDYGNATFNVWSPVMLMYRE
jgi:LruC domain-containing protein